MTEVLLARLITKVTFHVAGATKFYNIEDAAKAANLVLSDDEIKTI